MSTNGKKKCCNPQHVTIEFYDKIYGYVLKQVQSEEVAKDITQEVMGRMVDAYNNEKNVLNIRAWLFQVTRNIIVDRYRKDEIIQFEDELSQTKEAENDFELMAEDFIIPMIKLLPKEYATPLQLSDIDNLKQSEVATILNLSLSATKMRIQRARKKLYELFLECCDITYTEDGSFAHCSIKSHCSPLLEEEKKMKK
ncbi:MAG: sigma-70 family RNA polymerase sigma factor [Prolixibacteraceae bacterium]|jgi:RNA polymerase sigma-70 factor (ECF subfamily)|nr:sigma-70 family RNA polymerase sigma factor [Prolixibacteraceae bacterium]